MKNQFCSLCTNSHDLCGVRFPSHLISSLHYISFNFFSPLPHRFFSKIISSSHPFLFHIFPHKFHFYLQFRTCISESTGLPTAATGILIRPLSPAPELVPLLLELEPLEPLFPFELLLPVLCVLPSSAGVLCLLVIDVAAIAVL